MATEIKKDGVLYAILHNKYSWKEGLNFITPDEMFCQVGTFWYQEGKRCEPHRHICNDRPNDLTQECNIVIAGLVRVFLYDDNNQMFYSVVLTAGDLIVMVAGGHGFEILEPDTKIVECKNGPFISVEMDKEAI